MADTKPSTNVYTLLSGVNAKASDYAQNQAGFRDLRNMDFFQPNAIAKRPGSTAMVTPNTSGPVTSLFEFQKLSGESYIVAGTDNAMFYLAAGAYTLLSSGWTNGQPTDMLTFQNKLWMANGQKYLWWGGTGFVALPAGSIAQQVVLAPEAPDGALGLGASYWYVGGATMMPVTTLAGISLTAIGLYAAYSYLRQDGQVGPIDFVTNARNLIVGPYATPSGTEYTLNRVMGFTIPTNYGISAVIVYLAADRVSKGSTRTVISGNLSYIGNLGYLYNTGGNYQHMSETLIPQADTSRFHLFATIPGSSLFLTQDQAGSTFWGVTLSLGASYFDTYSVVASGDGFSGMTSNFFASYVPRYIEQNANVMFMSGFSGAPSTVQFTEVGQPEITQPDYNFEIRTNDGDRITGKKSYNSTVIVTKERSFSKIVGSTPDDLAVADLSTEYGCISNKTMVEYNQRLAWLDQRGVISYDGSSWEMISTPVEPIFRRMNLSAAREKAVSVNYQYRNQIWFGIPVDGSTSNNVTVVYDYLVGGWTFFDGFSPASFALAKGGLNAPTVWYGDYSGLVHSFGESLFGDNGRGITCLGIPNWENEAGQNSTSIWRRFFLDVASQSSGITGAITGKVFSNYDLTTTQATYLIPQNSYQTRAEMGVVGKAITTEFAHYSASLPLVIKGFSWTKRFLRNV